MNTSLTETQVFNEMHAAISAGDNVKLEALMKAEIPEPATEEVPAQQEEVVAAETQEVDVPATQPEPAKEVNKEVEAKDQAVDLLKELPDNLKPLFTDLSSKLTRAEERAQRFEHQARSHGGKLGTLNQTIEQLKQRLEEVTKPQAETQEPAAALKLDDIPEFAEVSKSDPAYAKLVEKALGLATAKQSKEYEAKINSLQNEQRDFRVREELRRETESLLSYEPRAVELMSMPEWREFKSEAPPKVRELASSGDHRDVLTAFQLYGGYLQARHPDTFRALAGAEEVVTAAPVNSEAAPSKVAEQRKQQLEESVSVRPTRMTQSATTSKTEEDLFKEAYAYSQKKSGYST